MRFSLRLADRRHVSVAAATLVFFALLAAGASAVSVLHAPSPAALRESAFPQAAIMAHQPLRSA